MFTVMVIVTVSIKVRVRVSSRLNSCNSVIIVVCHNWSVEHDPLKYLTTVVIIFSANCVIYFRILF